MSAGQEPAGPAWEEPAEPGRAAPPRISPTWITPEDAAALPGSPEPPPDARPVSAPPARPVSAPPRSIPLQGGLGFPSARSTAPAPTAPAAPSGPPARSAFAEPAWSEPAWSERTASSESPPRVPPAGRPGRRGWPGVLALLLVLGLGGVAGWQWREVDRLQGDLARLRDQAAQERADDRARLATLERRAAALEKQAGEVFNPQAVAAAVVPSVFRVRAGQVTGTAFVVARPGGGQGTHLLTNYHVVQEVWESGGRQVVLERRDQRFNARIVSANEANDVVHLSVAAEFPGLATTAEPVKSGQQIIVVGAPLGLEDTVTTGVVSAYRKIPDFPGTMIQFDASINPGNSGGPVINGAKQVVGIATAKQRDADGIGLAIPVKTACDLFDAC